MKARPEGKARMNVKPPGEIWDLKLYVIDRTLKSATAFANITKICRENLAGRFRLDVIDLEKSPRLARERAIVATPTLVKLFPLPMRRVIGDLSNTERVLAGLGLRPTIRNHVGLTQQLPGRA